MIKNSWGLLGPEFLPNSRRTRTLDVGVSVRWFNDRAVPGLGGVWYGKQLLLATLGIAVANEANEPKIRNIRAANAIEALACFLAYEENKWASDPRLRGSSKLQGKGDDLSFKCVSRKNFYVTQPMRMATVRALPSLGLVEANGSRFNAFQCSEISDELIKKACWVYSPYKRSVKDHLVKWVKGEDCRTNSHALRDALSPLEPLSVEARVWLRNLLKRGGNEVREDTQRRKNALTWVDNLSQKPHQEGWDNRPDNIDETHWHDHREVFYSAGNEHTKHFRTN